MSFNKEVYFNELFRKGSLKSDYSQFLKTAKKDMLSCYMREN